MRAAPSWTSTTTPPALTLLDRGQPPADRPPAVCGDGVAHLVTVTSGACAAWSATRGSGAIRGGPRAATLGARVHPSAAEPPCCARPSPDLAPGPAAADRARRAVRGRRARARAGRRPGARRDARPPRPTSTSPPRRRPDETERLLARLGRRASGTSAAPSAPSAAARATWQRRDHDVPLRGLRPARPASRRSTFGDSLEGDLGRRDFTVNAMAVRLPGREFVDPYGGLVDLAHAACCARPGTPEDSFSDDPLRMMRAARFAAQLGFAVAPEVVAAMTDDGRPDRRSSRPSGSATSWSSWCCAPYPRRGPDACSSRPGWPTHVLPELPALRARASTSTTGTRTSTSTR